MLVPNEWVERDSVRQWASIASDASGIKLAAVVYDGQIYTSVDSGESWTVRGNKRKWRSIASSSDGTKLAAVACFDSNLNLDGYISNLRVLQCSTLNCKERTIDIKERND
jgi:hypothetical protein